MNNKVLVALLALIMIFLSYSLPAISKVDSNLEDKFETAKMNLVTGETEIAQKQFIELEEIVKPIKDKSDDLNIFYSDIMYNLGLTFEQKYYDEIATNPIEGGSSSNLVEAGNYFEKSDPNILKDVEAIEGNQKIASSSLRAVGGILGNVLNKKVKEWLKAPENCKCSFTDQELNLASKTFVALTEKNDIPALKNLSTRNVKIAEIFKRIKKYLSNSSQLKELKQLFLTKIDISCRI